MTGLTFPTGMLVPVITKSVEECLTNVIRIKVGDRDAAQASFVIAVDIIITYPNGQQIPVNFQMKSDEVQVILQDGRFKAGYCNVHISE